MPNVMTGYDPYSGVLSASQQSDALAGAERSGGGGDDLGGIFGAIIGERRRREKAAASKGWQMENQARNEARQAELGGLRAQEQARGLAQDAPFARARQAQGLARVMQPDRVNRSSITGGPQASQFQDYAARMAGLTAAGVPIFDYTGMKDIVAGNAGASQAAVGQAGENLRAGTGQPYAAGVPRNPYA